MTYFCCVSVLQIDAISLALFYTRKDEILGDDAALTERNSNCDDNLNHSNHSNSSDGHTHPHSCSHTDTDNDNWGSKKDKCAASDEDADADDEVDRAHVLDLTESRSNHSNHISLNRGEQRVRDKVTLNVDANRDFTRDFTRDFNSLQPDCSSSSLSLSPAPSDPPACLSSHIDINMMSAFVHVGGDSLRTVSVFVAALITIPGTVSGVQCDAWATIVVSLSIICFVIPLTKEILVAHWEIQNAAGSASPLACESPISDEKRLVATPTLSDEEMNLTSE